VVVFLLLGVIWAAVLVPPWLQSRREARPIASIMSFRSQLWSLERATPNYGVDSYLTYDDAYDDDLDDDIAGDPDPAAEVHAFEQSRRSPAALGSGGSLGHDAADTASGVSGGLVGVPQAAIVRRRAMAYRRRRQVLSTLVVASAGSLAPAVVLGGPWVAAEAVASTLLVAYLGLLVRRGRREAERAQKVRYLTPIRAPRPSVVVIGSGAAR
jgi:hypothetical protein